MQEQQKVAVKHTRQYLVPTGQQDDKLVPLEHVPEQSTLDPQPRLQIDDELEPKHRGRV